MTFMCAFLEEGHLRIKSPIMVRDVSCGGEIHPQGVSRLKKEVSRKSCKPVSIIRLSTK